MASNKELATGNASRTPDMVLDCLSCRKRIEYSGDRPSFCPYCGISLSQVSSSAATCPDATTPYVPAPSEATKSQSEVTAGTAEDAPAEIGGYRLIRRLGAGGMGAVYEGVAENSDQHVAVKLLLTRGHADAATLERFRQEGRLASLIAHPNCVFVLRADEEAGRPYIVMELMSGETLRDEVKRRGPLPIDEAIRKTLDIIDGLIEAHRLNILHRDVKPSNCFLVPNGHVKIGDFGLSKSLVSDNNLTQTGAFLGTVLYAAPEQIRGDALDFTADVYAVCGTLYFMLTGQAPFQHENPAIVIAKVLSEAPPDVKTLRPDLSRRLQKIVMRGLERHREKRWQSMEELRDALAENLSQPLNRGSLGARLAAFVIDLVVMSPILLLETYLEQHFKRPFWMYGLAATWLYYAILETRYGASIGKMAMRLRVCDARTGARASFGYVALRTTIWLSIVEFGDLAFPLLGYLLLLVTMRRANGYRGLHEFASRTRVVQRPWPAPDRRITPKREMPVVLEPLEKFPALPPQIGGYRSRGVLTHGAGAFVLLVDDPVLGREVLLWVRPASEHGPSEARRTLGRPTRMRWLTSGETDGWSWDAFLAPTGFPFSTISTPAQPLGWAETHIILEQLTDELSAGNQDGTLLEPINLDQITVRTDGHIQIRDQFIRVEPIERITPNHEIELLRDVAHFALEGRVHHKSTRPHAIRAPLPAYASELLGRLVGVKEPFHGLEDFRTGLADIRGKPTETTSQIRLVHLALQALLLAPFVVLFLGFAALFNGLYVANVQHQITVRTETIDELTNYPAAYFPTSPHLADPTTREKTIAQLATERETFVNRRDHIQPGLNAAERWLVRLNERWMEQSTTRMASVHAELEPGGRIDVGEDDPAFVWAVAYMIAMLTVVGLWIGWAFVTCGGLTLPLVGLTLIRPSGRRAARWRAGLRALVVWTPWVGLLALCVSIKSLAPQWLLLHNAIWWASLGYLVGAFIHGIARPSRALHDRIAGVLVVPR
ncbi:MAG: protein kinase domain-containing protein [Gemmataceae bacterium]